MKTSIAFVECTTGKFVMKDEALLIFFLLIATENNNRSCCVGLVLNSYGIICFGLHYFRPVHHCNHGLITSWYC